jgi:lysophospholipase L1-like esterase
VATPISDPGGQALAHFYQALRDTRDGKRRRARVLVWGASHIAGDAFTRPLRHRLQRHYGDGGPGFVVPAKPWRNYNHRDVRIEYSKRGWDSYWVSSSHNHDQGRYGLAGISFAARRAWAWARVTTSDSGDFGRKISRAEVWYYKQPRGGDFTVVIDGRRRHRVRTRSRDAGPGYALFELPEGAHSVELRPRGNGEAAFFGLALERSGAGVVVDALGINGARAANQLLWDGDIFTEQLRRRRPDLVILAYGTNAIGDDGDPIAAYEARLELVMSRFRAVAPDASCVYVGPSDRPVKLEPDPPPEPPRRARRARRPPGDVPPAQFLPRPRQAQVIDVQRRVAHRHGCGYWDWAAMMGGDLSMLQWTHSEPRLGARDYVHLTRAGYERAADRFWEALMAGLPLPLAAPDAPR